MGEGEESEATGGEMDGGRLDDEVGWGGDGLRSNEASSDPLRGLVRSSFYVNGVLKFCISILNSR